MTTTPSAVLSSLPRRIAALAALSVVAVTPALGLAGSTTAQAATTHSSVKGAPASTQDSLQRKADAYVTLQGTKFVVSPDARGKLTAAEHAKVTSLVAEANARLASASASRSASSTMTVMPATKTVTVTQRVAQPTSKVSAAFREGVNRVEVRWYGLRVYLSKTTVQVLGGGVAIGGIWVPEPVVSKILATVGVVVALCPGGIAFNWTPTPYYPYGVTWGFSWQ